MNSRMSKIYFFFGQGIRRLPEIYRVASMWKTFFLKKGLEWNPKGLVLHRNPNSLEGAVWKFSGGGYRFFVHANTRWRYPIQGYVQVIHAQVTRMLWVVLHVLEVNQIFLFWNNRPMMYGIVCYNAPMHSICVAYPPQYYKNLESLVSKQNKYPWDPWSITL